MSGGEDRIDDGAEGWPWQWRASTWLRCCSAVEVQDRYCSRRVSETSADGTLTGDYFTVDARYQCRVRSLCVLLSKVHSECYRYCT